MRRIATELRPGILDGLGLVAAIEWQANEFQTRTGIPCVVNTMHGSRTIRTGDRIRVDGTAGTVEILARAGI